VEQIILVYLDTCCYGRWYDDITQIKIMLEAIAIEAIISICKYLGYSIIGSATAEIELRRINDDKKREELEKDYENTIVDSVPLSTQGYARARELELEGLGVMDSRHLATAETGGADFLLTTDLDFIRICTNKNLSSVRVMNPLNFLLEVIK
jgi:predicted nucleic acid-binding protein